MSRLAGLPRFQDGAGKPPGTSEIRLFHEAPLAGGERGELVIDRVAADSHRPLIDNHHLAHPPSDFGVTPQSFQVGQQEGRAVERTQADREPDGKKARSRRAPVGPTK